MTLNLVPKDLLAMFWWMYNETTEKEYGSKEYIDEFARYWAAFLIAAENYNEDLYTFVLSITTDDVRQMAGGLPNNE